MTKELDVNADGYIDIDLLPTGTGATQIALGNHTHTTSQVGFHTGSAAPSDTSKIWIVTP